MITIDMVQEQPCNDDGHYHSLMLYSYMLYTCIHTYMHVPLTFEHSHGRHNTVLASLLTACEESNGFGASCFFTVKERSQFTLTSKLLLRARGSWSALTQTSATSAQLMPCTCAGPCHRAQTQRSLLQERTTGGPKRKLR